MVTNNYYRTTHTLNSLWCLDLKVNQTTKNRQFVANQVITKIIFFKVKIVKNENE